MKPKISKEELEILYLPKKLPAIEIAKKIRLPQKANFLNKIDIDLTPYLKLPISCIGKSSIEWIYIIAPTQSAKTVYLQIVVAYAIDQDPGTLIYILPDEVSGKKALKEKVINMIRETPALMSRVRGERDLSTVGIHLNNMTIYPAWSGSLASLSSTPAKRVILDEVRLMKLQIGDESNALKLANDRLTTYMQMGLGQGFAVSTPSVEGDLLHQQLTIPNTLVLKWHTKCENCGKAQILDFFANMTKEGKCTCTACGHKFDDSDRKRKMNSTGFYAPDNGSLELPQTFPKRVVFWYTSMNSPFRSFRAIQDEFTQTKDKIHDYKNFIQCWLAQFWIDDISKTNESTLKERVVEDEKGVVPEWCKVLTAGIDTQDSGFYVVVRAWGENRKTRLIDSFFIECRLTFNEAPEIKRLLKRDIEDRVYATLKGGKWQIGLYAIDTGGHRTKEIYSAATGLERIILVKGAKPTQNTTIRYNKDYNLYLVRTIEYLEETEDKSLSDTFELHKNPNKDYLRQFVNMRKTRKRNVRTGEETIIWKKVGQFDYRMADVHSFICLDIPTSEGTFRRELDKLNFFFNPIVKRIENKAKVVIEEEEIYEEDKNKYEVGNFTEGW